MLFTAGIMSFLEQSGSYNVQTWYYYLFTTINFETIVSENKLLLSNQPNHGGRTF